MSNIYDNWERLVAAVLRKQQLWELFHAQSRSPSISSGSSDFSFSFQLNSSLDDVPFTFSNPEIQETVSEEVFVCDFRDAFDLDDTGPGKPSSVAVKDESPVVPVPNLSSNGVESIAIDGKDNKLTVTGDIDPVAIVAKLRKVCDTEILSVGPVQEPEKKKLLLKEVVLRLEIADDKIKKKVMKTVSSLSGIESIAMDGKDKKLTVTGDIDPVAMVAKLRKLCYTEIVSVGPAKEPEKKKEEPKKEEPKKEDPKKADEKKKGGPKGMTYYGYHQLLLFSQPVSALSASSGGGAPPYFVRSVEEDPKSCVIC